MSSRVVLLAAGVIVVVAVAFSIARVAPQSHQPSAVHATLPTSLASYLGVYEAGSPHVYQPVESFAKAAGRQPNLAGYFSGWAEPFAASFAQKARERGAVPLVQIDPSFASVSAIAAGDYDAYLRSYADSVRDFGHAVVIGFGHEMNAPWYSWGYRYVRPSAFVAAWRNIVNIFRGQGADNVTWLWTINVSEGSLTPWWPGAQYVTWVGIDGYYARPSDTFTSVFGRTIDHVRQLTGKPVLLSETAVGPQAGQSAKIEDLFNGMYKYKTLGLVWFDIDQDDGMYHQDWRIENNAHAEAVFRQEVREELPQKKP